MQPQLGAQQYAEQPSGPMSQPWVVPCGQLLFWLKAFLYTLVLLLLFLGFVLQLIGVGSAQDDCEDDDDFSGMNCNDLFRSFWWATFFQLLVCVGIGVVMLTGILKDVRVAAVAFLAMVTLQLIDRAEDSLDLRNAHWTDEDDYRTAAAGYVMSSMANFLLLLMLGIKKTPTPTMPTFMNNMPYPQAQGNACAMPQLPTVQYPAVAPQPGNAAPVAHR